MLVNVFGGYSFLAADVDVNALKANGTPYTEFATFNFARSRKDIRTDAKNVLDDGNKDTEYESNAGVLNGNRANIGRYENNQLLRHAVSVVLVFNLKLMINRILVLNKDLHYHLMITWMV